MKYRCCNCEVIFPCKDAIDGREMDFEKGFTCPNCKTNLTEEFLRHSKTRLTFETKAHERWFSFAALVGIISFVLAYVVSSGSWITFFVSLSAITTYLFSGYLRWGYTPYPNVIGTKEL